MIFKLLRKSFLGIDIGTSAVRMVELSKWRGRYKLENYGEVKTSALYKKPFRRVKKNNLLLSSEGIAEVIEAILKEAEIKTREVNFTIPDFSSFFTSFELPPMTKKELTEAIHYEAHHYIPLPMHEIVLDWQIIEGEVSKKRATKLKVLAVAIPKEVVGQYQQIASICELKLKALEGEVFALSRATVGKNEEEKVIALIDIGAHSSTVSIIEKGILKASHSFDISGNELTERMSKSLNIDYQRAEELKKRQGLTGLGEEAKEAEESLAPIVDLILVQFKKIAENFYQTDQKEVEKIILAGGSALLPGLKDYFYDKIGKEVEIANPFKTISCPPLLENILKEMGPTYSIAVGAAMRELT